MFTKNSVTRRQFVAGASGLLLAGAAEGAAPEAAAPAPRSPLALHGGEKAVKGPAPSLPIRWGEPEKERLEAMLGQKSLFFWKGPQTGLLVERFREVCPMKYVQTCSSGTAALHIAVAAAGIGPGDEVITSPITDPGTVIGVLYQQAVPVFADLGPDNYNLDVADVQRRITPKTKAIIAVHLLGNPCDLDALKTLADRHGLVLIEDCAQAWGARYRGRPIGTVGQIACFSLQDSKHVTCGDGGMVGSNDERFGPLLLRFGDKGFNRVTGSHLEVFGTNYRMSEPQAAVAAAQLPRLEAIAARRARLGALLTEKITGIPGIRPHQVHAEDRCVYWHHMFRLRPEAFNHDRAGFAKALIAEGVVGGTGVMFGPLYAKPVFQQHGFFAGRWPIRELGLTTMDYTKHKCPEAEAIHETCIRLTLHEGMTEDYILETAAAIGKVAGHFAA
jgi:dTDP-4-amino-4,6-dideoxygalactose transaminase